MEKNVFEKGNEYSEGVWRASFSIMVPKIQSIQVSCLLRTNNDYNA